MVLIPLAAVCCVAMLCTAYIAHTYALIHFKERMRRYVDNAKLSAELEARLVEMDDLKHRMNQLLLKQGLGR